MKIIRQALTNLPGGSYENLEALRMVEGRKSQWHDFDYQFIALSSAPTLQSVPDFSFCSSKVNSSPEHGAQPKCDARASTALSEMREKKKKRRAEKQTEKHNSETKLEQCLMTGPSRNE